MGVQTINCTADLGITSAATLGLQIKPGDSFIDYELVGEASQWRVSKTRNEDCSKTVHVTYSLSSVTDRMNGVEVRCKAKDPMFGAPVYSSVERLNVIQ